MRWSVGEQKHDLKTLDWRMRKRAATPSDIARAKLSQLGRSRAQSIQTFRTSGSGYLQRPFRAQLDCGTWREDVFRRTEIVGRLYLNPLPCRSGAHHSRMFDIAVSAGIGDADNGLRKKGV
jgi:hypothetical protein